MFGKAKDDQLGAVWLLLLPAFIQMNLPHRRLLPWKDTCRDGKFQRHVTFPIFDSFTLNTQVHHHHPPLDPDPALPFPGSGALLRKRILMVPTCSPPIAMPRLFSPSSSSCFSS